MFLFKLNLLFVFLFKIKCARWNCKNLSCSANNDDFIFTIKKLKKHYNLLSSCEKFEIEEIY